jgi:hypothetical protein
MSDVPHRDDGWYASASSSDGGEWIESTAPTPKAVLLALARLLAERKHRTGRPVKPFIPPPPRRDREAIGYYRSPEIDSIVAAME